MNIQETIERALASAGLDTRSGPMRGVTDTIRNALASVGLAVGVAAAPAQAAPPNANTMDVVARDVPAPGPDAAGAVPAAGQFVLRSFSAPAGTRAYKLYVPAPATGSSRSHAGGLPLVVMLHGCTQSADDFAAGTQMNRLADEHGFLVVYPEQASGANASRCWNWFRAEDQVRGAGEPALLAGLVQAVVAEHPVDPARVYVAGLSAGAAMALVLGETYPELFAAVGAHSGLPYAAAHDIPSALAAMKGRGVMGRGHLPGTPDDPRRHAMQPVPVIVFHGDRDHTVQHSNGEHIVQQAARAHAAGLSARTEEGQGRRYTRTRHTNAQGQCLVESWTLHGAGHAWSGGDATGSYTDRNGPDASAEMLRFFLALPSQRSGTR
ncbi:MAG: PHB depolymerase family esterase [Hydrogenophaga sp.]|uniref:extracellular catalytic domain type 1 short-chain-length polyhydroxyalkanoate depolymerase n=1 Tax=Hydrogenophaga sp. TaxID=1904254 RepID=UPI002731583C|nr:PHB depolymerase family esterase [Hydrogenophaga sp.]MDP2165970.1 PHB depolymerase family esterase [Hydrogenophaga sp.]MDP3477584.1 PHB depolymerase family esterase [Hydrogenophaga sp.]